MTGTDSGSHRSSRETDGHTKRETDRERGRETETLILISQIIATPRPMTRILSWGQILTASTGISPAADSGTPAESLVVTQVVIVPSRVGHLCRKA